MKCSKCGTKMLPESVGFCVIYECPECYNVEEVDIEDEEDM